MSSLFLKDLAQKTHRGLEGRVRKGKSAGGVTYGYDVVRDLLADGTITTGERTINVQQAAVVRLIFTNYSHGISPRAIATGLNKEGVAGPRGTWGSSTIYGNDKRGTGILNNELYLGRLVWNRQRFIKDPDSGRRQARMNKPEDWIIEQVPDLRIVSDDLWEAVKARQTATRSLAIRDAIKAVGRMKRATHLFTGMLKCGTCGGGFIQVGKQYYGCANTRSKGTCGNRLTIKREDFEARVLSGLKDQLLHPDLIAEYVCAYQAEFNQLTGSIRADRMADERELAKVTRQIDQMVNAIAEGMFHPSMKDKMTALESSKAALTAKLHDTSDAAPVLLHPGLADRYQAQVADLTAALQSDSTKAEATSIIRSLLTEIRLIPQDAALSIELVGALAGLLSLGSSENAESRPGAALSGSSVMVAGGRFGHCFQKLTHVTVRR